MIEGILEVRSYIFVKIDLFVEELLEKDPHFCEFWESKSFIEQNEYNNLWSKLLVDTKKTDEKLQKSCLVIQNYLSRIFSLIQEKTFEYQRVPADWPLTANNRVYLQKIYKRNLRALNLKLEKLEVDKNVSIYGGVKSEESLNRKLFEEHQGTSIQQNVLDIWDLVRFRICVNDLKDLLRVGLAFWNGNFENLIRCRNYYFIPRSSNPFDSYRALHFELIDDHGCIFEVQVMTKWREAVSLLDHAPKFKRNNGNFSSEVIAWLDKLSMAANIYEWRQADSKELKNIWKRI
jgi:ppGpp synthetase/RelA/SpoT-type nucleotidyltranferase